MKRLSWFFILGACYLVALLQACKEENVEDLFLSEQVAAQNYYQSKVLPVLNSKCFSCHTYHNTSVSRYDTYSRAAAMAREMSVRTSSPHANNIMPPPSAAPLTNEEKEVFQRFLQLVQGEGESLTAGSTNQDFKVDIFWTAYKFPDFSKREGVTGTFNEIYITYKNKEATDIYKYLSEAEILIPSNSINVGNESLKTSNVRDYFFANFTPVIHGRVISIDTRTRKVRVNFTMNGISQEVTFDMEEVKDDLVFTGQIKDIRHFNSNVAMEALQRVCGEFHQDKVWPDITLKAVVRNFKKFRVRQS